MPLYFAFGSNMSPAQMRRRCPGAQALSAGILDGYRFMITVRGGANILKAEGCHVHGVLWRVTPQHLTWLDRWEGTREGVYRRAWVRVQSSDGKLRPAVAYVADRAWPAAARPNYILTAILPGARAFGLSETYITELTGWLAARPIGPVRTTYRGRRSALPVRRPRHQRRRRRSSRFT